MVVQGRGLGLSPFNFRPNWGSKGRKIFFWRLPPAPPCLISRSGSSTACPKGKTEHLPLCTFVLSWWYTVREKVSFNVLNPVWVKSIVYRKVWTVRVLSRIYRLGEKFWAVEGNKLPRGGWSKLPRKFFGMNMRWDAIWCILRMTHNFEKCYSVCNDLVVSGWFFQYSYLYTLMITIFLGRKLGILGRKLLTPQIPSLRASSPIWASEVSRGSLRLPK